MPTTYFDSIGGRILGENVDGFQKDYMSDALGSVVGYRDGSGTVVNEYRYKPYGDSLSKSGIGSDPAMMFCGSWGYLFINRSYGTHSVRYRALDDITGRWTTVDPLWVREQAYSYAHASPAVLRDESGLTVSQGRRCSFYKCDPYVPRVVPDPQPIGPAINEACSDITSTYNSPVNRPKVVDCIRRCGYDKPNSMFSCMNNLCNSEKQNVVVNCGGGLTCNLPWPLPRICANTAPGNPCNIDICTDTIRERCLPLPCGSAWTDKCETPNCASDKTSKMPITLLHEFAHCCGLGGDLLNQGVGDCIAHCIAFSGNWP